MARLQINNHAHFTIVTNNNLEQKFIEGERRPLSEYLCKVFNNRGLLFVIEVDENVVYQGPTEKVMTSRDKFIAIAEEYPLIRELKDRLRLELDF